MILTIEATHTTITQPWDQERQEFSTDPQKGELGRITLYRDIPTLAAYAPTIADTEIGVLASSPEEFIATISGIIAGMEDDNPHRTYDDIYWGDQFSAWVAKLTLYEDVAPSSWPAKSRGMGVDRWYIEYDPWADDGYKHLLITGGNNYRQANRW